MEKYDEALLDTYLNSDKLVPKVRAIQSAIQSSGVATMDHITSLESLLPGVVTDHYSVKKLKTMTENERAECTLEALNLWGGLILGGGIALLFATIMHFFFGDSFGSGGGGGGGGGGGTSTPERLPETADTSWIVDHSATERELDLSDLTEKLRQKKGMSDTFNADTVKALKQSLGDRYKVPEAVANDATRSGDSLIRFITDVERGLFYYIALKKLTDKGRIKLLVGIKDNNVPTIEDAVRASNAILKHQKEINEALERAVEIAKESLQYIAAGKLVANTDLAALSGFNYTTNSPLVAELRAASCNGKDNDEMKIIMTLTNEIILATTPCDVDYSHFTGTSKLQAVLVHGNELAKSTHEYFVWYKKRSVDVLGKIKTMSTRYETAVKSTSQHINAAELTAQIHAIKSHFDKMQKVVVGLNKIMLHIQRVASVLGTKMKKPDSKHLRTTFYGDVDILTKIVASTTK